MVLSSFLVELIKMSFDAATHNITWDDFCDVANDGFNTQAFMILEYDLHDQKIPKIHSSSLFRKSLPVLLKRTAAGEAKQDDIAYQRLRAMAAEKIYTEHKILGLSQESEIPDDNFRKDVLAATSATSRLAGRLNDIGPWLDVLVIHSILEGKEISSSTRNDVEFILPILGKAIETSRFMSGLTREYRALLELFDKFQFGAAILDDCGEVIISNNELNAICKSRDGISLNRQSIVFSETENELRFQKLVAAARDATTPSKNLISRWTRRSSMMPYVIRLIQLHDHRHHFGRRKIYLLVVIDPEDKSSISARGLEALGVLSKAEINICELVALGHGTQGIAHLRSTSPETVRSQLKSVSRKLNCETRLDILRLVMATNAPFGSN